MNCEKWEFTEASYSINTVTAQFFIIIIFFGMVIVKLLKSKLSSTGRLVVQKSWFIISFSSLFILETISIFFLRVDYLYFDQQYARASIIIPQFIDMLQCTFELVHLFNGMNTLLYIDIIYYCVLVFYYIMLLIYFIIVGCMIFVLYEELKTNFCQIDEEKVRNV